MTTSQDIANALEQQIVFGRLHPSQRLVEDDIMEQFGATRHHVRIALEGLVHEGLARKLRNKGVQVRSFTSQEVEELYEIRDILQTAAIQRMPLPCSHSFVESLQDLCDEHRNAVTPQELLLSNNRFHEYFFGLCENRTLVTEIAAHTRATHPIRSRGFFDANYIEIARSEHQEIVNALGAGDRDRLVQLNSQHIDRPKQMYIAQQFS